MRTFHLATALTLALATLPALAAASHSHTPCGTSTLSVGNSFGVDVWANNACVGATVWLATPACAGQDIHVAGTHTLIIYGGCETGELVELP